MKAMAGTPGKLHRELKVPLGKPIPEKKLEKGLHSKNPTIKHDAVTARTFKGFSHGRKK